MELAEKADSQSLVLRVQYLSETAQVIWIRLREAMERYERNTGERITYDILSKRTGLSRATIEALGSRASYNPRLSTVESLCHALGCTPAEILGYSPKNELIQGEDQP